MQARPAQVAPNYKGPTPAKKPVGKTQRILFPPRTAVSDEQASFTATSASKAAPAAVESSEPATLAPQAAPKPKAVRPEPAAPKPNLAPSSPLKRQTAARLAAAPSSSDSEGKQRYKKLVAEREKDKMARAKASSPKTSRRVARKPVNARKKTVKNVAQSRVARAKAGKARRAAPPPRRRRGGGVPLVPLAVLAAGAVLLADSPKKEE